MLSSPFIHSSCSEKNKRNAKVYSGYTPENKLVNFTGEGISTGDLVKVKITEVMSFSLNGELVKE